MKITEPLNFHTSAVDQRLKIGVPQLRPIKFIEYLPMRLRDRVAGKTSKQIGKCSGELPIAQLTPVNRLRLFVSELDRWTGSIAIQSQPWWILG